MNDAHTCTYGRAGSRRWPGGWASVTATVADRWQRRWRRWQRIDGGDKQGTHNIKLLQPPSIRTKLRYKYAAADDPARQARNNEIEQQRKKSGAQAAENNQSRHAERGQRKGAPRRGKCGSGSWGQPLATGTDGSPPTATQTTSARQAQGLARKEHPHGSRFFHIFSCMQALQTKQKNEERAWMSLSS